MDYIMYLEIAVFIVAVSCLLSFFCVAYCSRKIVKNQEKIMDMIYGYEYQLNQINDRLYNVQEDTYNITQRMMNVK